MEKGSTLFLKGVVVLLGFVVAALCVLALYTAINAEGLGGYRSILFGVCVLAIPFFVALVQTMKLLGYIDKDVAFSQSSVNALKNIKYCGIAISALYAAGLPYIYRVAERDDAPGVILIGMVLAFAPIVVAVFAAVLQKLLQNAIDIKSENDLTV